MHLLHLIFLPKNILRKEISKNKREDDKLYFKLRGNSDNLYFDVTGYWSYPILVKSKSNDVLWMYLIAKTIKDTKLKNTAIFRPFSVLLTKPNSKSAVHQDFRIGHDPFPKVSWDIAIGFFPHDSIKNLKVKEFEEKEVKLLRLCNVETSRFKEENKIADEFSVIYNDMCNPVFKEFISCLAPEFHKLIWSPTQ
jgi:hypothetical protein